MSGETHYWIGIDPGASTGALSILDSSERIHRTEDFDGWSEMFNILSGFSPDYVQVYLEYVYVHPGMNAKAATTFMKNAGGWEALLAGLQLPHTLVHPNKWQKNILGTFPKGESKPRALAYAQRKWPEQSFKKSHHGKIDASLIALYGVRQTRSSNVLES